MRLQYLFGFGCLLASLRSSAIMPATREQILCASSEVVVATVYSGSGADCRLQWTAGPCSPQDLVRLSIAIQRTLAAVEGVSPHRAGDEVQVSTSAVQVEHPEMSDDLVPAGNLLVVPSLGRPLTDQDVQRLFVGREYIFALSASGAAPIWASTWDMQREAWVREVLVHANGEHCPLPMRSK